MKHIAIENLSQVQQLAPVYLIETDYGHLGTEICGDRSYDRKKVVEDLATASRFRLVKVLEIDEINGTCKDVTKDFAQDIADSLYASREPVSYEMRTWLQQQLGVSATNQLVAG